MSGFEECERCGNERLAEYINDIELADSWRVCDGCMSALQDSVEYRDWQDRYTEEQHERALSLLSERDEFECIISSYEEGQIILHTKYVSYEAVADYCEHFGFRIIGFGPRWMNDGEWPCETKHGDIFEIALQYDYDSPQPVPLNVKFSHDRIQNLDGNDEQF